MRNETQVDDPVISRWHTLSRKERAAVLASIPEHRRTTLESSLHRIKLETQAQGAQDRNSLAGHSPWLAQLIEDVADGNRGSDSKVHSIKPAARKALLAAHKAAEQSSATEPQPSLAQLLLDLLPQSWRLR